MYALFYVHRPKGSKEFAIYGVSDVMTKMSDNNKNVECLGDSFGQRTNFIGHFV